MHQISAALMVSHGQKGLSDPSQDSVPGHTMQVQKYWWDRLKPLFAELILVASDPVAALAWKGLIVYGQYRLKAPLEAVRAALRVARHEQLLIVDPALPMISPEIVDRVAASAQQRWDVIAWDGDQQMEMVPLVYHKRCLKMMDHHLARADYTMKDFYRQVRLHTTEID